MTNKTIATGQNLKITFPCDADMVVFATVIERNNSYATLKMNDGSTVRRKVKKSVFDGSEYIFPYGSYSMAPVARPIN